MSVDTFSTSPTALYMRPLDIKYSIVDVSQNSGAGGYVVMNQVLITDTLLYGHLSACRHANGRDWWIITHELFSNRFYKIHNGKSICRL